MQRGVVIQQFAVVLEIGVGVAQKAVVAMDDLVFQTAAVLYHWHHTGRHSLRDGAAPTLMPGGSVGFKEQDIELREQGFHGHSAIFDEAGSWRQQHVAKLAWN